jgi:hypothetical protein
MAFGEHFWEAEEFSFQGQQAIREPHVLFFDSTQSFSHVFTVSKEFYAL